MPQSAKRVKLGSWTCPSGNSCDVWLRPAGDTVSLVDFEWDRAGMSMADVNHYHDVILPEVTKRLREYREISGRIVQMEFK